jgi:hypothetical protein
METQRQLPHCSLVPLFQTREDATQHFSKILDRLLAQHLEAGERKERLCENCPVFLSEIDQ